MSYSQQFPSVPPQLQYGGQIKKTNGMAVAGFVLALLGALTSILPVVNIGGSFLAALGLIFGIIGLVKSRGSGAGKALSIAAVILAVAAIVISVLVNVVAFRMAADKVDSVSKGQNVAAPVTGKIGEPVKDGKLTFVVNSVLCGMTTSRGAVPSMPRGEFCAVDLSVSNHGADAQRFDANLIDGFAAGTKYVVASEATLMADPAAMQKNLRPGGSTKAVLLIDVPAGVRLDTVEVHDSVLSEGTSVSVR